MTKQVIGCAFRFSNTLGSGFLEKVYENTFAIEFRKSRLDVKQQAPVSVLYDGIVVGEYFADLLVSDSVIVELKSVREFGDAHAAQCLNYLKATGLPLACCSTSASPVSK